MPEINNMHLNLNYQQTAQCSKNSCGQLKKAEGGVGAREF